MIHLVTFFSRLIDCFRVIGVDPSLVTSGDAFRDFLVERKECCTNVIQCFFLVVFAEAFHFKVYLLLVDGS